MQPVQLHPVSLFAGALLFAAPGFLMSMQGESRQKLPLLTNAEKEILSHLSIVSLDDGSGSAVLEILRVSDANLQVVNGLEATNGNPTQPISTDPNVTEVNGLGNLILGYNEPLNPSFSGDLRTGSHSLVMGIGSNYSSFGGVIAGAFNNVTSVYSSAPGGGNNVGSGDHAVAVGGGTSCPADANVASGSHSAIVGGASNSSAGGESVIVGGFNWTTTSAGVDSVVVGGHLNRTSASFATVLGGVNNEASGSAATVVGGIGNVASGVACVVRDASY